MVIAIHRTDSGYSFCPPQGQTTETLRVQAPAASQLLPIKGIGERLFVPGPGRIRLGHDAADVVKGVGEGRFRVL